MKLPEEQIDHPDASQIAHEVVRGKYFYLLLAMLTMTLLAPILQGVHIGVGRGVSVTDALYALILLAAVYAIKRSRRHLAIALCLIVPAALCSVLEYWRPDEPGLVVLSHALLLIFLAYLIGLVLGDVLMTRHITADTIKGAACIYLMLALFWAMMYSLCAFADPAAFRIDDPAIDASQMVFHRDRFGTNVYFSLVTITTLGYGDVVPASPVTRALTSMEAVIGQFYLTVLVARLVGMHIYAMGPNEE